MILSAPYGSGWSDKQAVRLLVAEDHLAYREVLLAVLSHLGYRADAVPDGREAVKALQAERYDLVLMDCHMPEIDGFEATRLIRDPATGRLNPRIPVIAVTASAMEGDRGECIAAGMDDYLSKPVEPDSLDRMITTWLGREPKKTPDAPVPACIPVCGPAVFDPGDLMKRLAGKKVLAEKVLNAFLQAAPTQLSNLRLHLTGQDVPAARREAHTLKGAAATISAPALRGLALEAEQAAAAGEWPRIEELIPRMEDQLERLRNAIAQWE